MRSLVVVVALAHGCGSVSGNDVDAAVNHSDTGSGSDATPPACNLTAPFGTPVNVGGVNSNSVDEWASLSADLLTIYFSSAATNSSDLNIYYGTRSQPTGPFSGVMLLPGVNTTDVEDAPTVTADGKTLFAHSNAMGAGTLHIYVATRSSPTADFSALSPVTPLNSTAMDGDPNVSGDGLTIYLASTRSGSGPDDYNLFRATRTTTSMPFPMPMAVGELNMPATYDVAPVASADGLEIFFGSTRGISGTGARNDIWHAVRSSTSDGFGMPTKVVELSTDLIEDFPTWLAPDRCTILFTSDRPGGNGGLDIWMATRPQ